MTSMWVSSSIVSIGCDNIVFTQVLSVLLTFLGLLFGLHKSNKATSVRGRGLLRMKTNPHVSQNMSASNLAFLFFWQQEYLYPSLKGLSLGIIRHVQWQLLRPVSARQPVRTHLLLVLEYCTLSYAIPHILQRIGNN